MGERGGDVVTPLVVRGFDGATLLLNSPWAGVMESGFLLADISTTIEMMSSNCDLFMADLRRGCYG